MRRRTMAAALAVALAAGTGGVLSTVPAASAAAGMSASGTLLFVKGHNLWMARGDGSAAVQLTDDGTASSPYSSPSMADNGQFAAAKGGTFAVWQPNGDLVASWKAEQLFVDSKGGIMPPPFDPVLSPDGTKVAYQQVRTYTSGSRLVTEGLVGISPLASGVLHDVLIGGDPAWLGSGRVMLADGGAIDLYTVDSDVTPVTWFSAEDFLEVGEYEWNELSAPALSPDGQTVMVEASSGYELAWARVVGDPRTSRPPAPTQLVCRSYEETPVPDGFLSHYENPDYGPEADSAVFEQYGDIFRVDGIGACGASTAFTRIVAGGSDPDWSPVPYSPPSAGTNPGPGPDVPPVVAPPTNPGEGAGAGDSAGAQQIKVKGKAKLMGKARVGEMLKVNLRVTKPKKVNKKFVWLRNGKRIKGAKKAKLRLTRADRGKKISVKVTLTAKGHQRLVVKSTAVRVR